MIESKRRAIIFLLLALLLAAAAGYLTLQKVRELNTDLGTMVNVYVAGTDISSRSVITPDDITIQSIPQKYVTDEHIVNTEDLVNKVSVIPLSAGDVLTRNMLKEASAVTEENNRLVTLLSSERVFFDEQLEALDRVDVIVSTRTDEGNKTEIFMRDVKVAKVAKEDGSFSGIQVEIALEEAPELIHMQNYADSVRIVKANVGLSQGVAEATDEAEDTAELAEEEAEEQQEEQKEEEKQEEKKEDKKDDEKKDEDES
jgi:Flp pilus assembly protein CpaB